MIKLVYDKGNCVGCPPEMGCLGLACDMCYETKMICDICKEEVEDLYVVEGEQMCENCFNENIINNYPHITIDNVGDYAEDDADA